MDADFAKRWVARLRDPQIKQTNGCLKKDCGMCCLGVAEEVAGNAFAWDDEGGDDCDGSYIVLGSDNNWASLTSDTQMKYGFHSIDASRRDGQKIVIEGESYYTLADANDDGVPFSKIADYIEANYEAL